MTAVFTNSVVANLKSMAATTGTGEMDDLLDLLGHIRHASDVLGLGGGQLLARVGNMKLYTVKAGRLTAVLTDSPGEKPDTIVVTGVYLGDAPFGAMTLDALESARKEAV